MKKINATEVEIIKTLHEQGMSYREMASTLNCSVSWVQRRMDKIIPTKSVPQPEPIISADVPIGQLLDHLTDTTTRRIRHADQKRWRKFHIPDKGPYALMFFGDPHVDDNGANWELLRAHCALAAQTEALYAVNIGDTTNNWAGRLAALWANQDTSAHTARRLARWLLSESGVPWFLWLHGNHDAWAGPVGAEWFEAQKPHSVTMEDWGAKVTLVSPNGHELRLWAQHNFKGHSMWNNMHGPLRAAMMEDWAHLYVAGHHHDFGIVQQENAHRRYIFNLIRARGYKFVDDYATHHQFPSYEYGASVVAVVDPSTVGPNQVQCYADPFEAVEILKFKRNRT